MWDGLLRAHGIAGGSVDKVHAAQIHRSSAHRVGPCRSAVYRPGHRPFGADAVTGLGVSHPAPMSMAGNRQKARVAANLLIGVLWLER